MKSHPMLLCSFCGRHQRDVGLLLAGLTGHICDACCRDGVALIDKEAAEPGSLLPIPNTAAENARLREALGWIETHVVGPEALSRRVQEVARKALRP